MRFTWDENKAQENIRKHKISFDYAILVFDDEYYLEEYDCLHSDDEDCYNIIGMVDNVLFVVCTYRGADEIRIISARVATKDEKRRYEKWLLLQ